MRLRSVLGAVVLSMCYAASARADIITINPNALTVGTDLSHLFPGVSMSIATQVGSGVYNPVRSAAVVGGDYHGVGSLTMGGGYILADYCGPGATPGSCTSGQSVLELTFDAPANFVQINASWFSDGPGIIAFDSAGNRIGNCFSTFGPSGVGGCDAFILPYNANGNLSSVSIARSQGDISRIVFGGVVGQSRATSVTYGVPEPTTLGLMGIGLAGAAIARRRRRQRS